MVIPPPAMLLDGFEECEIAKVSQHRPRPHKRQPTTKSTLCLGRVWGLRNVHGFLSTSLGLRAVQEYWGRLQSLARSAPGPGKATTADPQYVDTSASPAHAASPVPAQQQKKRGRPAKRRNCSPSCKQHKKVAGGQAVRRSARLSDEH